MGRVNVPEMPLTFNLMNSSQTAATPDSEPALVTARTGSPEQTKALAAALSPLVRDGDLIVLAGDLGAGKTCFSQGFGAGLGITERMTSPTFTLHNQYQGRLLLNHLDVYRLDQIEETLDLDLPEMLESGVTLIEWGEQIDPALPSDHLIVRILMVPLDANTTSPESDDDTLDDARIIQLEAGGATWAARLGDVVVAIEAWNTSC